MFESLHLVKNQYVQKPAVVDNIRQWFKSKTHIFISFIVHLISITYQCS